MTLPCQHYIVIFCTEKEYYEFHGMVDFVKRHNKPLMIKESIMKDLENRVAEILKGTMKVLLTAVLLQGVAMADMVDVDMERIKQIESSGDPFAYNPTSKAVGAFQITAPVVQEWNTFFPKTQVTHLDMYDEPTALEVANWYMNNRIPSMLRYYKLEDTIENRLKAYNWGIGNLVRGEKLPQETQDYLKKYWGFDNVGRK